MSLRRCVHSFSSSSLTWHASSLPLALRSSRLRPLADRFPPFFGVVVSECSAKTRIGVKEAFEELVASVSRVSPLLLPPSSPLPPHSLSLIHLPPTNTHLPSRPRPRPISRSSQPLPSTPNASSLSESTLPPPPPQPSSSRTIWKRPEDGVQVDVGAEAWVVSCFPLSSRRSTRPTVFLVSSRFASVALLVSFFLSVFT